MNNENSADGIGAEYEENEAPRKIVINSRPRVTEPESTGSKPAEEIDSKPYKAEKPAPASGLKSSTLTPDISEKEARPKDDPEQGKPKVNENQATDELAEVAVDKKAAKDTKSEPGSDKNVEALIENKTYFVPIGQVTKRRNAKIFVAIVAVTVAAGVGAYFLMTA